VALFSLLAYGLALYQKGTLLSNNSISLIQLNQGGTSAHSITYMGLFVPSGGNLHVQIPGESLTEPVGNQFLANDITTASQDEVSSTISTDATDTSLNLRDLGPWTSHPLVSEQDLQFHGQLTTHLAINNSRLMGTITNTLPTDLNDVYVLLPHGFAYVGHLPAGTTQHINLPLSISPLANHQGLAAQIAQKSGLSTNYFPYTSDQQPQTDFQRHIALLSALGGTGFFYFPCNGSCTNSTIINRDTIFFTGGQTPGTGIHNDYDPLLIPGSSATLIGWANRPLVDNTIVTVNGSLPSGYHDSFLQAPLNIDMTDSSDSPPDFITGHIVNINSYDAQTILPDIYSLSAGNITFEIAPPDSEPMNSFTLIEPDLTAHPSGPRPGDANVSHLRARLYNWLTNSWDTITFYEDSFTTTRADAYFGPDGRLLLQISSQNKTPIYFGKPSLDLHSNLGA
jgi:hypothetical protein